MDVSSCEQRPGADEVTAPVSRHPATGQADAMAPTPVTTRHDPDRTRVEAVLESGEVPGFSEYDTPAEGVYRFFHTEVDEQYAGQGIAGQIAEGVMDFVRSQGARIDPTCSYIRKHMQKNPGTHDLLADGVEL